ncbi:divergent polysaccharide deacetylase family protein [Pseudooceanicola sp.]|uniref:divergent polysaccharide deacetylase family protein n=1 Tax=Pseudooceanicola sp. TaxID=1914328 RepID=UPI0035C72489
MLRGILLGSVWGLVLGGGFLAIMSLTFPATVQPPPETSAQPADAPRPVEEAAEEVALLPAPLTAPDRHDVVPVTRPDPISPAATPGGDVDPGEAPVLTAPDSTLAGGQAPSDAAPASPAPDSAVLPSPQALPPAAPAPEAEPEIATQPAEPPRADPGEVVTGFPQGDLTETAAAPERPTAETRPTEPAQTGALSSEGIAAAPEREDAPTDPEGSPRLAPQADAPDQPQAADLADRTTDPTTTAPDVNAAQSDTPPASAEAPEGLPAPSGDVPPMSPPDSAPAAEAPQESADTPPPATSEGTASPTGETDTARSTVADAQPGADRADPGESTAQASPSQPDSAAPQPTIAENPAPQSDPPGGGTESDVADAAPSDEQPVEDSAEPAQAALLPRTGPASDPAKQPDPASEQPAEPSAPAPVAMPGQPAIRLTENTVTEAEPTPDTATADPGIPVEDAPPIDRYAAPFDNPEGQPILSIVLLDSAEDGATVPMPDRFPYPVSIAVPVDAPDAADRMRRYRDAGLEVLALAALPEGATPADVATLAPAWFDAVPEAVAIMERPPHRLQSTRDNGEQLAGILEESGHGLLLFPQGLETTRKLAARRDVPAATVFRDLDGSGQGQAVIRRFLDNSAFKAGLEGSVILVARLRPETIEALLVWGLADRASRVALAPVSAALKAAGP